MFTHVSKCKNDKILKKSTHTSVVYVHNGVLFSYKEEWNDVICRKMERNGHVKWNKLVSQRQGLHIFFSYVESRRGRQRKRKLKGDHKGYGGEKQRG
jgi:hypothetical protein